MYVVLTEVIKCAIPLWNMTLSALKAGKFKKRIEYDNVEYNPDPDKLPADQRPTPRPYELPEQFGRRYFNWDSGIRRVVQPAPATFEGPATTQNVADGPGQQPTRQEHPVGDATRGVSSVDVEKDMPTELVDLERDYGDRGLQIVVELTNIELTPESPAYHDCIIWHGSGQMVSIQYMRQIQSRVANKRLERTHLRLRLLLLRHLKHTKPGHSIPPAK